MIRPITCVQRVHRTCLQTKHIPVTHKVINTFKAKRVLKSVTGFVFKIVFKL